MQSVLGSVTVGNVGGSTALTLDDSADQNGRTVNVTAAGVAGLSTGTIYYTQGNGSTINLLTVLTGAGQDTLNIISTSPAAGLSLNTGPGNDTVNLGATNNQIANLSGTVSFNGGSGNDVLNIDDQNAVRRSIWSVNATNVQDLFLPEFLTISLPYTAFESLILNGAGGAFSNLYNIVSTAAATPVTVYEGTGNNTVSIGDSSAQSVQGVTSPVTIHGNSGTDTISMDATSSAIAVRVHVNPTQVGAANGDTLFPTGGSLTYTGISSVTLTTTASSAGDSIWVTPSATTAFTVNAGNPTTQPGDTLTLFLAGASNTINAPNGTGAGQYSFSNRQPVTYTGIESQVLNSVSPFVMNSSFAYSVQPQSLAITFNEDVSASLTPAFATVVNQTKLTSASYSLGAYDHATNSITLNFPAMTDGHYRLTIPGNTISDANGINLSQAYTFDFFVLTGDANHDGKVDGSDYSLIDNGFLRHLQGFSNGDFNYDGVVNGSDYTLIDNSFNQQGANLAAKVATPAALVLGRAPAGEHRVGPVFVQTMISSPPQASVTEATAQSDINSATSLFESDLDWHQRRVSKVRQIAI